MIQTIDCGYSLEPPGGGTNVHVVLSKNKIYIYIKNSTELFLQTLYNVWATSKDVSLLG